MSEDQTKPANNKDLTVTPASEWRKPREEGYEIQLPSGNVPRLRPVEMSVLLMDGTIPDFLSPIAAKSLWLGEIDGEGADNEESFQKIEDIAPNLLKLYNIITKAAFVYPRIVDDPKEDDEISLYDVDTLDKVTVFSIVTQGVTALKFFRDQQKTSVEPTPNSKSVRSKAKRNGGNKRRVDSVSV